MTVPISLFAYSPFAPLASGPIANRSEIGTLNMTTKNKTCSMPLSPIGPPMQAVAPKPNRYDRLRLTDECMHMA